MINVSSRTLNSLAALFVFLASLITYVLCLDPSVSWWDCGEFISSAYRLEVGHPPGAPLYMLLGRFFSLFAVAPEQVARMVNLLSALASAFTVLFLYLTIVLLANRSNGDLKETGRHIPILSIIAGMVGSLVYAFSDSFWFSAVEAEVYALSSLFTAIVFWAILRWDREADRPGNIRWILLIAFLTGLSIGVHLLNLLAIPAIVLFWYYRKFPQATPKGALAAFAVSLGILALMVYGLIPGVATLASWFELFFVNLFGMPFNSGLIVFVLLLMFIMITAIRETHRNKSVTWNTLLLAVSFMLIGYSSYITIMIRSQADPPMNQNNPDNVFSLTGYLNREQYGDRPLLFGPSFNAPVTGQKAGAAIYDRVNGRYEIVNLIYKQQYDSRFLSFFPRMWNNDPGNIPVYKEWSGFKGKPVELKGPDGRNRIEFRPTFKENLSFFFRYQIGHMYLRYFMWNFSGRQNDTESQGGIRNGNWITGIGFIDNARLGPQKFLPDRDRNNKSRNKYYLLPLLLGLTGVIYQFRRARKDFWVVLMLFVFTGIAIVIYLNQYPNQPRERDYSYAGSFYAFAIWVGLGVRVPAFAGMTRKRSASGVRWKGMTGALALFVPLLMAVQNWDDHDRSGRFFARDFAFDYLNSCASDAILFTNGDNDTFPLWYAQEVEGIRTDVRVICLPYLASDWYIDQLKRKARISDPVPFSLSREQYGPGKRDYIPVIERVKDTLDLQHLIDFLTSENESAKVPLQGGGSVNYIPTRNFRLPVDACKVLANGTVSPEDKSLMVSELVWKLTRPEIYKNDLMILDLIAHNKWERPIYFTSIAHENILGLQDYFRLEGFAYRLVPIPRRDENGPAGSINTGILYDRLMNTFKWGNISDTSAFIDSNTYMTTLILQLRQRFADLADALIAEGKIDSARAVLDRVVELLPARNFRNDWPTAGLAEMYYRTGNNDKANNLLKGYLQDIFQDIRYIRSVKKQPVVPMDEEAESNILLIKEIRRLAESYNQVDLVQEINKMMDQSGIRTE